MATESSVVVALREVRRLELERQKREEDSRRAQEEEAARRATIQYESGMSPFSNGNGHGGNGQGWTDDRPESFARPMRRTTEVVPLAANGGYGESSPFVQTGPWDNALGSPPEKKRGGAAFKAVLLTLIVCGVGAGFGYLQLEQKFAAKLSASEAEKQKADEARHEAVAARSKAEQELKVQVAELEGKLMMAQAKAAASAAIQAAAAARMAAADGGDLVKPAALNKTFFRKGRGVRPAAKVMRPAAALKAPPLPKPATPKMAKKKSLSDDPLGGLRL